jgi:integrase
MSRTIREVNLSTREARKRLKPRGKPYWRSLDEGLHLGYRKGSTSSAWVIRWYVGDETYKTASLEARPDDILSADGETVLSWSQAQAGARNTFQRLQREAEGLDATPSGPYTVAGAFSDYMAYYRRKGGKAPQEFEWTYAAFIEPTLGSIQLAKLTRRRISEWHEKLSLTPARMRTRPGEPQKFRDLDNSPEGQRRRRSTANHHLTKLKAILNHAFAERRAASDEAWRGVKAFREVDAARTRYLPDDESRRLVNACGKDFRPLVQAALLTGARYGELTALRASDYNPDTGTLHIRISKSGKPRHVVLTDEGRQFFEAAIAGKAGIDRVFVKPDGHAWGKAHQQRPFREAIRKAKLEKLTFHELRHTYASRLMMKGVPLAVVAAQLGHTDTRMAEKHYGHMAPSYVAETVRAAFGPMGIVEPSNVLSLKPR